MPRNIASFVFFITMIWPLAVEAQVNAVSATGTCNTCAGYTDIFCDSGTCHGHGEFGALMDNLQKHSNGQGWPYSCATDHNYVESCEASAATLLTVAGELDLALFEGANIGQVDLRGARLELMRNARTLRVGLFCPATLKELTLDVPLSPESMLRAVAFVAATTQHTYLSKSSGWYFE